MTNAKLLMNRRSLLSGGAAVMGTSMLATPTILRAQDRKLRVGAFGGYFNDAFTEGVYPAFTQATGIEIESIAQPTSEVWLVRKPKLNIQHYGKSDDFRAGFKVAEWRMFCHSAWSQISPARFKQVYSDKAGRTHDRNLQTSETLKLTFAEKEPSTHDSAPSKALGQKIVGNVLITNRTQKTTNGHRSN